MRHTRRAAALTALCLLSSFVAAQDVPSGRRRPPRPIVPRHQPVVQESEKVTIKIANHVARTSVQQVFRNPSARQMEHTYLFPLPAGAVLDDFKLHMNGKPIPGEVLDKDKARRIYEGIVRARKDPGLLELIGTQLIRARIFPVPPRGTMTVDLEYAAPLAPLASLHELVYPLRRKALTKQPFKSLVFDVHIETPRGLKTVYSPTHKFDIRRDGENKARLSFEASQVLPEKDLQLFYGEQSGRVGMSTISYHPPGEDGYFLLILSPGLASEKEVLPKDIVFVVDTSGSMVGEKIEQVKKSLEYCVSNLKEQDRFAVIPFSTEARPMSNALVQANKEARGRPAKRSRRSRRVAARTSMKLSLRRSRSSRRRASGPFFVVFLTDGLPTIGVTNGQEILKSVKKKNTEGTRIFVLGVGHDVNTKLLDNVAEENARRSRVCSSGRRSRTARYRALRQGFLTRRDELVASVRGIEDFGRLSAQVAGPLSRFAVDGCRPLPRRGEPCRAIEGHGGRQRTGVGLRRDLHGEGQDPSTRRRPVGVEESRRTCSTTSNAVARTKSSSTRSFASARSTGS